MRFTRSLQTVMLITVVAIFGLAGGVSAADQKVRVKVPGIT
ncbi:MAG TPA: hypothetical protein VEP69_01105 [Thermodesulfovibrionales bacterium]|nr:hypothetical protein [Thermodesulfovibrionales bacterium]